MRRKVPFGGGVEAAIAKLTEGSTELVSAILFGAHSNLKDFFTNFDGELHTYISSRYVYVYLKVKFVGFQARAPLQWCLCRKPRFRMFKNTSEKGDYDL